MTSSWSCCCYSLKRPCNRHSTGFILLRYTSAQLRILNREHIRKTRLQWTSQRKTKFWKHKSNGSIGKSNWQHALQHVSFPHWRSTCWRRRLYKDRLDATKGQASAAWHVRHQKYSSQGGGDQFSAEHNIGVAGKMLALMAWQNNQKGTCGIHYRMGCQTKHKNWSCFHKSNGRYNCYAKSYWEEKERHV